MAELNIVLVEPEIPQNTGNIARTCAATGARLHLVRPMGFEVDDKKLKRAGLDYWYLLDITYYDNLDDFFEKNKDGEFFYFSTKAQKIHTDVKYPDKAYLVFGKETRGLPEWLLMKNKEHCVRIPMLSEARSLNLSNSVAVATYETLRQWDYPELLTKGELHRHSWDDA
ncbi:MAG: tRNA (uridine(34)/cytosine(34)/5-carboxymethylaminomethyluridine(34)-2'-O)-methyltransferase TrmL [Eubacteriales bacterium]|nr:tRNA (uridine(34)/cytosine(34)/5-carboxymethylaminomethyluridine(34)-2'-O)-methyltransferase TrmL [Eubacteriales bacterium]